MSDPGECPDYFQELTGWRKFSTASDSAVLSSAGIATFPVMAADMGTAFCASGATDHEAPFAACSCGYYCYKTREDAEAHCQGVILAQVKLWGRVVEHARGYRAEHMRIAELYVRPSHEAQIERLARRYGVAVLLVEGESAWTSEKSSGQSSFSPFLSPSLLQNYQTTLNQAFQNYSPPQFPPFVAPTPYQAWTPPQPSVQIGQTIKIALPRKYVVPEIRLVNGVQYHYDICRDCWIGSDGTERTDMPKSIVELALDADNRKRDMPPGTWTHKAPRQYFDFD